MHRKKPKRGHASEAPRPSSLNYWAESVSLILAQRVGATIEKANIDISKTVPSAPLTREALYALVWSEPMLKVGARYGVSSSYMARVCSTLNVPRPERGYWAKLVVGKALPMPPLPDARPGDELAWSPGGRPVRVDKPLPRPPLKSTKRRPKSSASRPSQHPLISGAKAHFEAGCLSSYNEAYLKPYKKLLVDMVISKTCIDKALSFSNRLFWLFEEYGYRVVIAPSGENFSRAEVDEHELPRKNRGYNDMWSPWRCTVVYIGTVAIGLTIIEMSEEIEVRYVNGKYIREQDYVPRKRGQYAFDHSWTTKKYFPTGRLCLQAYSPYPRAKWTHRWQETKNRDLNNQINVIVKELERAAVDIARLVEEGERQAAIERQQWEARQEQWRREESERRAIEALKKSRAELFHIIDMWAESNRIEQFFQDAAQRAANLSDDKKLKILERLKIARELVGSIDALEHFMKWRSPDER